MDRLTPAIVITIVVLALLALMIVGWRTRRRRQRDLATPLPLPQSLGEPRLLVRALAHATTRAGDALDRVAVHGLGFRAQSQLGVHAEGIVFAPTGRAPVFIPRADVRAIGRGTWTIDRAVEPGGLVVLTWALGDTDVDTYLRVETGRDGELLAAVTTLLASDEGPHHDA